MTPAAITRLAERVAAIHGVDVGTLFSATRTAEISAARWQVWHEAEAAGATKAKIARAFGMDWTSVHHGISRHRGATA